MMEIFDPFRGMMPHCVPGTGRSKVGIGGPAKEAGAPRYRFRVFVRVRSHATDMRVSAFMPLKGAARHEDPVSLVNLFRTVLFLQQGETLEVIHGL
jgi:hypothetical protein